MSTKNDTRRQNNIADRSAAFRSTPIGDVFVCSVFLRGKIMFGSIPVLRFKHGNGPFADLTERQEHVSGVEAGGIHIHGCEDTHVRDCFCEWK